MGGSVRARMQSAARRGAALIAAAGIAAATPGARPLLAQQTPAAPEPSAHHGSPVIKWGKWAAAAAAVSFTTLGIRQHNAGDAGFSDLVHYCRTTLCTLAPGGRYADPEAEALYQRVVRDDRLARVWFIGGQVAALGSALLFVLELRRTREPPSIPFSGLVVRSDAYGVRLGWRLAF